MWAESGLGGLNELNSQPTDGDHWLPPGMKGKEDEVKHRSELGDSAEAEDNKAGSEDCPSYQTNSKCRSDQAHSSNLSADISFPETVGVQEVSGADGNRSLFVCLKKEHEMGQ